MLRTIIIWTLSIVAACGMWVMLDNALSSPAFVNLLRLALESKYD